MKLIVAFVFVSFFAHGMGKCSYAQSAPFSPNKIVYKTVTIANAGTISGAADIGGYQLVGITLPATMTGTALSMTVSTTVAGTYSPAYNTSGALSYTIAGARYLVFPSSDTVGIQFVRLVSGSAEAGARTITLHLLAR